MCALISALPADTGESAGHVWPSLPFSAAAAGRLPSCLYRSTLEQAVLVVRESLVEHEAHQWGPAAFAIAGPAGHFPDQRDLSSDHRLQQRCAWIRRICSLALLAVWSTRMHHRLVKATAALPVRLSGDAVYLV